MKIIKLKKKLENQKTFKEGFFVQVAMNKKLKELKNRKKP